MGSGEGATNATDPICAKPNAISPTTANTRITRSDRRRISAGLRPRPPADRRWLRRVCRLLIADHCTASKAKGTPGPVTSGRVLPSASVWDNRTPNHVRRVLVNHGSDVFATSADVPQRAISLVRLRLGLALATTAILAVLVTAPVVLALVSDRTVPFDAWKAGVGVEAIARDLVQANDALTILSRDRSILRAGDDRTPPTDKDRAAAAARLRQIAALGPTAIAGAGLFDPTGSPIADSAMESTATAAKASPDKAIVALALVAATLSPGTVTRSQPWTAPNGEVRVAIATPVAISRPEGGPRPVVVEELSLTALLAAHPVPSKGTSVRIVDDADGTLVASLSNGQEPSFLGDDVERLTLDPPVLGLSVELAPRPDATLIPPPVPFPALAAMAALFAVALALTLWMARQVLRPAEELESSRRYLGEMYALAASRALEDSLTGLANHRAFQEEFDRELEQSSRYRVPIALLVLDLDDFKIINDSAGHAVGDELLVEMGRILRGVIRRADRAFRVGGDEFAVLMPHTDADTAEIVGRRLLASCVEPGRKSAFPRPFSFSAGISAAPKFGSTRSELYAQADAALYAAKRSGRTTVEIYDPGVARPMLDPAKIAELSAAVARIVAAGALRPVYQPIVEIATGRVIGFEGLVRPEPGYGFDNPGTLFVVAEASGRTADLDRACLEAVVRGAVTKLAPDQRISLNISPRSLAAPEFGAGFLLGLLRHHGIAPQRVTIELTERESVEDVERLRNVLRSLQAVGIGIAADDVGAGNAGLRLLSQIPFDIVKIDLSLVQAGAQRDAALAVLRSLTDLAARWGAMAVAEGVETSAQLRIVRDLGIGAAQGYLLGRPVESPSARFVDVEALLAAPPPLPFTLPGSTSEPTAAA